MKKITKTISNANGSNLRKHHLISLVIVLRNTFYYNPVKFNNPIKRKPTINHHLSLTNSGQCHVTSIKLRLDKGTEVKYNLHNLLKLL